MRSTSIALAAGILAALGAMAPAQASTEIPPPSKTADNLAGVHDFDFLVGDWHAAHHQLKDRLAGSHDWIEFDGTSSARKTLGGLGNMDDNVVNKPSGSYRAVTIRAYDPKSGQWAIWWLDGRDPSGNLDPPVRGSFVNGVGTFYSDDMFRGKSIRVRYVWSQITATSCHWEQAFSPDSGATWETNWTTDFRRVS